MARLLDADVLEQWTDGRSVSLDAVMYVTMTEAALLETYDPATDVFLGFKAGPPGDEEKGQRSEAVGPCRATR